MGFGVGLRLHHGQIQPERGCSVDCNTPKNALFVTLTVLFSILGRTGPAPAVLIMFCRAVQVPKSIIYFGQAGQALLQDGDWHMVTLTTLFGTLGFAMYIDGYEAGVMSALETYYGPHFNTLLSEVSFQNDSVIVDYDIWYTNGHEADVLSVLET